MVVLRAQPEDSSSAVVPRFGAVRVADEIGDGERTALDPEPPRHVDSGIYRNPRVSDRNRFGRIVRFENRPRVRSMSPDEEVVERAVRARARGLELRHVDLVEVNEGLDLAMRLAAGFFLAWLPLTDAN